jgi:hypothetical protein
LKKIYLTEDQIKVFEFCPKPELKDQAIVQQPDTPEDKKRKFSVFRDSLKFFRKSEEKISLFS